MTTVRIDRLALRVAGLTEDESRSLAMALANRLALAPVRGASRRIDALRVTVTLSGAPDTGGLADRIANELARQIAREGS